jgi:SAM-dependent methyltransferase
MHETSKAIMRRMRDSRFARHYFVGDGIDIGAGRDTLAQYAEFFPAMRGCRSWDLPDGDAQLMPGLAESSFDFVHSSHCLEHMVDVHAAFARWLQIVRPGGYLVILVPDEDLYEQGQFPSRFNPDHKWTFTISKSSSWSPKSISLLAFLHGFADRAEVLKIELLNETFRYSVRDFDQTLTPVAESAIEFIVRRR